MATPGNCWESIAVFNQHTLKKVLGGRHDIGNPNLHVAVDCMTDEQNWTPLFSYKKDAEALEDLPNGRSLQAVVEVQALLPMYPTSLIADSLKYDPLA